MKTSNYLAKLPQEATIKSIQVLKDYDLIRKLWEGILEVREVCDVFTGKPIITKQETQAAAYRSHPALGNGNGGQGN